MREEEKRGEEGGKRGKKKKMEQDGFVLDGVRMFRIYAKVESCGALQGLRISIEVPHGISLSEKNKLFASRLEGITPPLESKTLLATDMSHAKVIVLPQKRPELRIFVKDMHGRTHDFFVERDEMVEVLKQKIQFKAGIPPENQRLIFAGKQLEKDRTLRDYNIPLEATLHLVMRFCGQGHACGITDLGLAQEHEIPISVLSPGVVRASWTPCSCTMKTPFSQSNVTLWKSIEEGQVKVVVSDWGGQEMETRALIEKERHQLTFFLVHDVFCQGLVYFIRCFNEKKAEIARYAFKGGDPGDLNVAIKHNGIHVREVWTKKSLNDFRSVLASCLLRVSQDAALFAIHDDVIIELTAVDMVTIPPCTIRVVEPNASSRVIRYLVLDSDEEGECLVLILKAIEMGGVVDSGTMAALEEKKFLAIASLLRNNHNELEPPMLSDSSLNRTVMVSLSFLGVPRKQQHLRSILLCLFDAKKKAESPKALSVVNAIGFDNIRHVMGLPREDSAKLTDEEFARLRQSLEGLLTAPMRTKILLGIGVPLASVESIGNEGHVAFWAKLQREFSKDNLNEDVFKEYDELKQIVLDAKRAKLTSDPRNNAQDASCPMKKRKT